MLLSDDARASMIERVFPHAALITPNKHEAEVSTEQNRQCFIFTWTLSWHGTHDVHPPLQALVGRRLRSPGDVEEAARELLGMGGCGGVLLKGGHSLDEGEDGASGSSTVAQDYLLERGKDRGIWISTPRSVRPSGLHRQHATHFSQAEQLLAVDNARVAWIFPC
jgi:hydroxymethylpyrimidine/phosphomethylpyrimidine kinase